MTSQTAVCVEGSTAGVLPCIAAGDAEIVVLTQETEAAAAAMAMAVGQERNVALQEYKQSMRRLVQYLAAHNALEHQAGFYR